MPPGMDVSIHFELYSPLLHRLVTAGLLVPSRPALGTSGEKMETSPLGCTVCMVPALSWRGLVCSFRSNLTRGFWDSWAHLTIQSQGHIGSESHCDFISSV